MFPLGQKKMSLCIQKFLKQKKHLTNYLKPCKKWILKMYSIQTRCILLPCPLLLYLLIGSFPSMLRSYDLFVISLSIRRGKIAFKIGQFNIRTGGSARNPNPSWLQWRRLAAFFKAFPRERVDVTNSIVETGYVNAGHRSVGGHRAEGG